MYKGINLVAGILVLLHFTSVSAEIVSSEMIQMRSWGKLDNGEDVILVENPDGWYAYTSDVSDEKQDADEDYMLSVGNKSKNYLLEATGPREGGRKPDVSSIEPFEYCGDSALDVVVRYQMNLNNDPEMNEVYMYDHIIVNIDKKSVSDIISDTYARESGGAVSVYSILKNKKCD